MKRALVITYYWPPTGGSGVQRWLKFAELLPRFGWEPVIYTPENPEQLVVDESLLDEIPAGTEIIKTHITEPYGIYRKFTGGKGIAKEVNIVSASADKSPVQRLSMFVRGNFFVPDPRCLWIRPSVRFLKRYIKEHPIDVIISTGPPNSMHLIGRNLKRETGLPWIADFRDPWTEIFYFKHIPMCGYVRKKHLRLEKSVLDEADTVVAVSPIVQQDFMKALIQECLSLEHWGKIKAYIDLAMENVETDLDFGSIVWFAAQALGLNGGGALDMDNVYTCTIPANYYASSWSRATSQEKSYVTIYPNHVV